jgi:Undecaprenyl-phosphate glucose phosphotransferase
VLVERHFFVRAEVAPPPTNLARDFVARRKPVRAAGRASFAFQQRAGLMRSLLSLGAALVEAGAILATSIVVGVAYHIAVYEDIGILGNYDAIGLVVATLFVAPNASRGAYAIENLLTFRHDIRFAFTYWNVAFFLALGFGFIIKASADFSRGAVMLFYVAGFASVLLARGTLAGVARELTARGLAPLRQIFVIGHEADVETFRQRCGGAQFGLRIVAASLLREPDALAGEPRQGETAEDIRLAVSVARFKRPEDIFIMLPWSERETIERCVDAFLTLPAAIHVNPERILNRFGDLRVSRLGPVIGLNLVREPLSVFEVLLKRCFDLSVSAAALILFAPFFLLVALLIKLDSAGPVFFVQRRYGFNQEPFPIFKFRSMTASASQGGFQQATKDDARVTRVGRFLRRWNIDELPQLLNVFLGDMSLVGPRPHALSHDGAFEEKVALYARRHNVKPGITGWAQTNGFRGETSTDEHMRQRVEHDLHYIDNWSFWLDLKILFMTVFSHKAYRNAF